MAVTVDKPTTNTSKKSVKEKSTDKLPWDLVGIIFLLLLFVGLPLAITVWTIGTPVKGYNA